MSDAAETLRDPKFRHLLKRRSRLRWGLSISLVGGYLAFILAGLFVPETYARPFFGTSIPWGVALGDFIIVMSIVLSLIYVRVVNRWTAEQNKDGQGR